MATRTPRMFPSAATVYFSVMDQSRPHGAASLLVIGQSLHRACIQSTRSGDVGVCIISESVANLCKRQCSHVFALVSGKRCGDGKES